MKQGNADFLADKAEVLPRDHERRLAVALEFAVLMLGTPLIVVLGHQRCGAVQAAIKTVEEGATFPGSIGQMVEPVVPAVEGTRAYRDSEGDAWLDAAIRENVRLIVERLRNDVPSLRGPQSTGQLRIVGAEYSLDEGKADFFLE